MSTAARSRRRSLAGIALAPLTWLERARGRWRLALATLYLLILAVAASLSWRAFSLWALPDIGEPFDVTAFQRCDVPDDKNAFVLYEQAAAKFRRPIDPLTRQAYPGLPQWEFNDRGSRSSTDPTYFEREERAWLDVNVDALALWRRGAERTRACPRETSEPVSPGGLHVSDAMAQFTALALLQGERSVEAGDVAGAWGWYNAALRCNRHLLARGKASELFVAKQWQDIRRRIVTWAHHPEVDPELLRRALGDVVAADALSPPEGDEIRRYYLDLCDELGKARGRWIEDERAGETSLLSHMVFEADLRWYFKREPERSLRLARIAVANWLAHREHDRLAAPAVDTGTLCFWSLGPEAPAAARALGPDEFARWAASSLVLGRSIDPMSSREKTFQLDRAQRAQTILLLAARLYELDHGAPPASDRDLVGPYLKRLPPGYADLLGTTTRAPAGVPAPRSSKPAG